MRDDFGNPSSAHRLGLVAANHVDASRRAMLAALGDHAGRGQLLWTSGGTEADALAVLGFFIVASVPSPRAQPGVFAATRTRDVTPV
jgi:cysteine sulfinate desulfinase/cysteine desulfurase-like protein